MIEMANEKSAGLDINFWVALIEAIPFPDHCFDLVTSSLMLHHLPDDLKREGLAEIRWRTVALGPTDGAQSVAGT
jgi:ubiquinone/menaquinone biosynthesis C-methylase UbiE